MRAVRFAAILHLAVLPVLHARSVEFQLEEAAVPKRKFDHFVVEVHAVADKEYHEYFDYEGDLETYIAVMLNAVNLFYRNFSNPRVTFRLTGVTRIENEDDLPRTSKGAVITKGAFQYMREFYEDGKLHYRPDVLLLLTNRGLLSLKRDNTTSWLAGVASGLTCRKGVAISTDAPGTFDGVYATAHELAHTLKGTHCPRIGGYLPRIPMCREKEIHEYLLTLEDSCIKETAEPLLELYPAYLPGDIMDEEDYCEKRLGKKAYGSTITFQQPPELSNKCKLKCCYQKDGRRKQCKQFRILDGMSCGEDKECRAWQCVPSYSERK